MNSTEKSKQFAVNQAIANERLEGLKVSSDTRKIAGDYVVGKVSAKEAAKKIKDRYRAH